MDFLVFSTATCRRVQPRGRLQERKGGRAPLGLRDEKRNGAFPLVAMREITNVCVMFPLTERSGRRNKAHPLSRSVIHHGNSQHLTICIV